MVKVSSPTGSTIKNYTSAVVTHPVQTGYNYITYTVNHNLGVIPDEALCYTTGDNTESYKIQRKLDLEVGGANGAEIKSQSTTQTQFNVFRLNSISVKIYFKVFVFGGDHRAS